MSTSTTWTEQMQNCLGPKGYCNNLDEMAPWLTDWRGRYTGKAAAILAPASTEEVSAVVKIASKHKISLVPQGGNSGMVGGATPDTSGRSTILSLRRMNKIRKIDSDNKIAICDAGVILQNFHEALEPYGQRFPLTLGGKGSATIGGLVSTNAGGTQVLRHGTMRALVAGIEAVMPDGNVYNGLAALKKDNRGYDIKQLLIGGEGTLGIVTGATLMTSPALVDRCVAWIGVESPQAAYKLFQFLDSRQNRYLEGFEIIPASCLNAVLQHIPDTRAPLSSPSPWNVLIEIVQDQFDAENPSEMTAQLLSEAIEKKLGIDATIANSEAQAEAFWKLRDSIAEAERADGPALQHDISVPVPYMADFITNASPKLEAAFPDIEVAAFGHMGDGNVHFHVKGPKNSDPKIWMQNYAGQITPMVHDLVMDHGGSISAEHGIGQNKRDELARLSNPAQLATLRSIKTALDPQNIMNPGKLVPLAS